MSLKEKLDAMRAAKDEGRIFPPDVVALMHKSTAELAASGQAERALKAGDLAPSFVLPDADGARVSSKDLLAKGPLVLTFYRGVWCPYCNLDLQAIEEVAPRIRALGAALAAVSQQTAPNSRKSQADNKLSFPILNDKGGETAAGADLSRSSLVGADLTQSTLSYANLQRADLTGANLNHACVQIASLKGANLRNALVRNSWLCSADLSGGRAQVSDSRGQGCARVLRAEASG